jgi:hypothetical protein
MTATRTWGQQQFTVDISAESRTKKTKGLTQIGAITWKRRCELMTVWADTSGHVDGIGQVTYRWSLVKAGNFRCWPQKASHLAYKGSDHQRRQLDRQQIDDVAAGRKY